MNPQENSWPSTALSLEVPKMHLATAQMLQDQKSGCFGGLGQHFFHALGPFKGRKDNLLLLPF